MIQCKIGFAALLLLLISTTHEDREAALPAPGESPPAVSLQADGKRQRDAALLREVPALTHGLKKLARPEDPEARAEYHALRARPDAREKYLPETYDLDAVNRDPGFYERIDYTRPFQKAAGSTGRNLPSLERCSLYHQVGLPGEGILFDLIAKAMPGRPVTFWAPRSGFFSNGHSIITVKSDAITGLARTSFRFGPGTGAYPVLASSPENAGFCVWALECTGDRARAKQWRDKILSSVNVVNPRSPVVLTAEGRLVENAAYSTRNQANR